MKLSYFFLLLILLIASFLRFYKVDEIPHGLYLDEVSIGYNAYTILTEGVDEYGISYPLFFKAFGEYKMPVSIYLTSASIATFGKNDFAVRLPSVVAGVLSVLLIYLLVRILLLSRGTKQNLTPGYHLVPGSQAPNGVLTQNYAEPVALLSAFLLAITPWHIQFSRAHFEANIALFLYLLGSVLFLHFLTNKQFLWFVLSSLSFVITAYTYNAYKLIVPVTLVFIVLKVLKQVRFEKVKFGITLLVIISLLLPLFLFSGGNSRFLATSAFSASESVFSYPIIYLQNYLSFFSLPFLFVTGDGFGRHTIVGMGPLFRWELPFLLFGLFALLKERKTFFAQAVFFLFLIAPATAAFTNPSPHALRSFLMVIPLTVIVAYGIVLLWQKHFFFKKIVFLGILLFAVYEFCFYLHSYYLHYPIRTAPDWGGAYKEVIWEATKQQQQYQRVVINDNLGTVAIYANFYNDTLNYELVNDAWVLTNPGKDESILYITSSSEKRNKYLQNIPHTLIKEIPLASFNKGIFAQFWEL